MKRCKDSGAAQQGVPVEWVHREFEAELIEEQAHDKCELEPKLALRNPAKPLTQHGKAEKGVSIIPAHLAIIGFDAEWVATGVGRNRLLSYQWHVITARGEFSGGLLMPEGARLTFREVVKAALERAHVLGLMPRMPKTVYLVAHTSLADLSHLVDFTRIAPELGAVQKNLVTLAKPIPVRWTTPQRHVRAVEVYVRDTARLSPVGGSLAALGRSIGVPKVELPRTRMGADLVAFGEAGESLYRKEAMDVFLEQRPASFMVYGENDAVIAARFFVKLLTLYQRDRLKRRVPRKHGKAYKKAQKTDFWNNPLMPATLGAWGVREVFKMWGGTGLGTVAEAMLGLQSVKKFDPKTNRYFTTKALSEGRGRVEDMATRCFHGGRSEAFTYGYSAIGEWSDYDLSGAYTTAMASMGIPDWNGVYLCTDPAEYAADLLGFALIDFEFPEGTRFPCIPVKDNLNVDRGMVFPLSGRAYVTAPEIATALWAGGRVEIVEGWIVPWRDGSEYPYAEFTKEVRRRRGEAKARGDELEAGLWKTVGNSLYGKQGQGLRGKKGFNTATGRNETIGPSKITVPALAAYTTGLVRAVLSEILHAIPPGRSVLNAVTDGLLTDATPDELAMDGPAGRVFAAAAERIGVRPIERKHIDKQVLVWKTRGDAGEDKVAQGGIYFDGDTSKSERSAELHRLFRERLPGQKMIQRPFESLRNVISGDLDLQTIERQVTLNMDYDMKRRPVDACEREGLLAFSTRPWQDLDEWRRGRDRRERWTAKGRLLKTMEDWRDFVRISGKTRTT